MKNQQIFAVFLIVSIVGTMAYPALEDEVEAEDGVILSRQRRVTCDVFSFEIAGVKVNDSACALHCLQLKKRGGRCRGGVCYCR